MAVKTKEKDSTLKLVISLLVAACAFAQAPIDTAPAKSVPFSAAQQAVMVNFNIRNETLRQEERAIAAETALLQSQANAFLDGACRAAGGERCELNTKDADPAKWSLTIITASVIRIFPDKK